MSLLDSRTLAVAQDFPLLNRTVHGKRLTYLDNAATTQKPRSVLEAMDEYYTTKNANIHRGVHQLSQEATEAYEQSRTAVRRFIGAKHTEEIIFTRGTTEAINLVASSLGLQKGDGVLATVMEHHSNIVPWQLLAQRRGITLDFSDITDDGMLDMKDFNDKLTENVKLVAVCHASNVLGTINDVKKIATLCHKRGALALVDGAQGAPHLEVDVRDLDADFYAFSGHKMYGPTRIGCLYARKELLESMEPYQGGGDMIREVHLSGATWNDLPWKFEAGTPNIAGAIGLGAAVTYLERLGMSAIRKHELALVGYAMEQLAAMKNVKMFGPADATKKTSVVSFNLGDIHAHDVATILDGEGVAIRSGHHCAQPLMERFGVAAMSRASLGVYNTRQDVDTLVAALGKARKIFKL